jgi:hypothetical protein
VLVFTRLLLVFVCFLLQSRDRKQGGGQPSQCPLDQLPPEPQTGNCEYKLKLVDLSEDRFQHLVSQMHWRISEGAGVASYMIGIADNGTMVGLSDRNLRVSLDTLARMAAALQAKTTVRRQCTDETGGMSAEVVVTLIAKNLHYADLRIAMIGDAQSGKSSLASVLASDELDDGRGKARLELFRHGHEIRSGRTSSIGRTTLAFDASGAFIPVGPKKAAHANSPLNALCCAPLHNPAVSSLPWPPIPSSPPVVAAHFERPSPRTGNQNRGLVFYG